MKILKIGFATVVVAGCAVLLFQYSHLVYSTLVPELASAQQKSGLSSRIKIPSITVDAAVEHVGLTSNAAMGVPKGPTTTAWFERGPRPGEIGSAVIAGHYGWKDGIQSAFDDLYRLKKGDKVYFENSNGVVTTFVVRELKTYGENADATEVFNSSDGKAHLNLITCEGAWNKENKSYANRLVVFTDLSPVAVVTR